MNILLITNDQHRWDFIGNRTVPTLRTPSLERLQSQGTTLTNNFTACPLCLPARFTWMYGLYANQGPERMSGEGHDWPTHLPSMAHALQGAGYHTALIGKLHSHSRFCDCDLADHAAETHKRGFDDVLEVSGKSLSWRQNCAYTKYLASRGLLEAYRDDVGRRCKSFGGAGEDCAPSVLGTEDHFDSFIGREVRKWLGSYDGDRPFFLHASFVGPHFPYDPPAEYHARYQPKDMPPPEGPEDDERVAWFKKLRAAYCGLVELVDTEIGRVLDALEARGWADNTLVIFSSDHGDMMGNRGLTQKMLPFDTSARTPGILRLPGVISAGGVLEDLAESVDLPCTILAAAGAGNPDELLPNTPGRSYWDYVTGQAGSHRSWAYSEHGFGWRMCRERDWKYVFWPEEGDMLFDMSNDPYELDNRIDDPAHADRVCRMRRQLLESMRKVVGPNTDSGEGCRHEWVHKGSPGE